MAVGDGPYSEYIMGQVEARTNQIIQTADEKESQYQTALDTLAAAATLAIDLSNVELDTVSQGYNVNFPDQPDAPYLVGFDNVDLSAQAPEAG